MDFKSSIQSWVSKDNEIKKYNEILKELRQERKTLEENICTYAKERDINNSIIKISDSTLSFKTVKQQQAITLKYIQQCLEKCIDSKEHIDIIMKTIRENRESKFIDTIYRS